LWGKDKRGSRASGRGEKGVGGRVIS
jgi:hypothetical protein